MQKILFAAGLWLGFTCCNAQYVPVHEEPHHKTVHLHGVFRYLSVQAQPGDTCAYHRHENPILYLNIQSCRVWLDELLAQPRYANLPALWMGSDSYSSHTPMVHRFSIAGNAAMHLVAIERIDTGEATFPPGFTPVYDSHGFAVFELSAADYTRTCAAHGYPAVVKVGTKEVPQGSLLTCRDARALHTAEGSTVWLTLPGKME